MKVRYKTTFRNGDTCINEEHVAVWIASQLERGSIESQSNKIRELLTLVAEQWLYEHPDLVPEVAWTIRCPGRGHELTSDG